MRKFLMVAAVVAVAACSEKAPEGEIIDSTNAMTPAQVVDSAQVVTDSAQAIADSAMKAMGTDSTNPM